MIAFDNLNSQFSVVTVILLFSLAHRCPQLIYHTKAKALDYSCMSCARFSLLSVLGIMMKICPIYLKCLLQYPEINVLHGQ